ncbi:MAG TPA: translation initiation factor eIF-2B, partial [Natronoarchaeum rubrum]|nr:translation initiation factor eIF-2B [Natronoarchaeum rubrum]
MINETVAEIEEMQTSSSSTVAIKATRALESLLDRDFATVEEFERDIDRNVSALRRANPSHASLQNAMLEVKDAVTTRDYDDIEDAKRDAQEVIDGVVEGIEKGKRRAAANAVDLFEDGMAIMT